MRGVKAVEVGKRFGRLVVVALARVHQRPSGVRVNVWTCQCDCGGTRDVFAGNLTNAITQSCGCLQRDVARKAHTTHGKTHTPEYQTWFGMIRRCCESTNRAYPDYGGRGIVVCDAWRNSFVAFLRDMGNRPSKQHSLDRIDNDGPYSKENCRWATVLEQANNKRGNIRITVNGTERTATEWSRISGVNRDTIVYRISAGCPAEMAVFMPPNKRRILPCSS